MEKILNQDEIDALIRATQNRTKGKVETARKSQRVTPYTFGQSGRITAQQVGSVSLLHDTFARNVSQRLGAFLRVSFEATLVSVEQLTYNEFMQRVSEVPYLATINLQPVDATAVLDFDLKLAFPIIDLLLGGDGAITALARDATEIEEQILESVMKIICQELEAVWDPLVGLRFIFDQRQPQAQAPRLIPPAEKVLSLSFEVRIPALRGSMNVAVPAGVASTLLRKISEQWLTRKRRSSSEDVAHRRRLLETCRFPVEMMLGKTAVRGRDLLGLEPGQVLVLQHRVSEPVLIAVAGRKLFAAFPVASDNHRGGMVQKKLQIMHPSSKESS